ncbi:MAG: PspC domain-containing protein [Chloroflexota bacterium]
MTDRLYRSADDRMLGGVCAGLAARLGIDPSIVRVVWALLILPTGLVAVAAYFVMWLVVPLAPAGMSTRRTPSDGPRRYGGIDAAPLAIGGGLILFGAWFLLRDLFPFLDPARFWPVALVILGIGLIVWAYRRSHDDPWSHRP